MNSDFTNVHSLFFEVDANNIDFALRIGGVEIPLDEFTFLNVFEIARNYVFTDIHYEMPFVMPANGLRLS